MLEILQPFAIAFSIGLLIGIERERSIPKGQQAVGMRTFILYAIIGVIIAEINKDMLTLTASLFVFMSLLLTYFRTTQNAKRPKELGVTTEVAAGLVYLLGFLSKNNPILSLSIGITLLLLLLGRRTLHQFARDKITTRELQAVVTILIISLGILSFLPNKTIDPWGLFNPQHFGLIILALALIQFGGYVAIRIFGENLGMLLTGFLGGLISSTVVFATLSSSSTKQLKHTNSKVAAAVYSILGSLIEFLLVIIMVSPKLALHIMPTMLVMMCVGASSALLILNQKNSEKVVPASLNPLDMFTVLRLAVLLAGILLLVTLAKQFIGEQAIYLVAFATGLFELQAISYATATLYLQQQIKMGQASELLAIIVVSSFLSKFVIMWVIARNRFALITTLFMCLMLLFGALVMYFPSF